MKIQFCLAMALALGLAINSFGQNAVPVPELISPGNQAELDNGCVNGKDPIEWNFKWSEVPGARRYQLYVIGARAKYPLIDLTDIKKTSYKSERQAYVSDYNRRGWRWKVRVLVGNVWSAWSAEGTFDVEPIDTDCN